MFFTFKVLVEKAISSIGCETNLLMLDMSKAFDTLKRDLIIKDLRKAKQRRNPSSRIIVRKCRIMCETRKSARKCIQN